MCFYMDRKRKKPQEIAVIIAPSSLRKASKRYQSLSGTDSQPTSWMLQIKTDPVVDTIFQLKILNV